MLYKIFFLITIVLLIDQCLCEGNRKGNRAYGGNVYDDVKCAVLDKPKYATMKCNKRRNHAEVCTAQCIPGFGFAGIFTNSMKLQCINGEWRPRNNFPGCVLLQEEGGIYKPNLPDREAGHKVQTPCGQRPCGKRPCG